MELKGKESQREASVRQKLWLHSVENTQFRRKIYMEKKGNAVGGGLMCIFVKGNEPSFRGETAAEQEMGISGRQEPTTYKKSLRTKKVEMNWGGMGGGHQKN